MSRIFNDDFERVMKIEDFKEYKAFTRLILGFSTTQILLLFTWFSFIPHSIMIGFISFFYLTSLFVSLAFGLLTQYRIMRRYRDYMKEVSAYQGRSHYSTEDNAIPKVPEPLAREIVSYRIQLISLSVSFMCLIYLILSSVCKAFFILS